MFKRQCLPDRGTYNSIKNVIAIDNVICNENTGLKVEKQVHQNPVLSIFKHQD